MFKKRPKRGSYPDVISDEVGNLIDDAKAIEVQTHAVEKALKRYIQSRREEVIRVEKLVSEVETALKEGASTDATAPTETKLEGGKKWLDIENKFNDVIQSVGLDPVHSFTKIFPELTATSHGYQRAATDFKRASEKLKTAQLKGKDTVAAQVKFDASKAAFEKQTTLLPQAYGELLSHRFEYHDLCLRAVLQAHGLYAEGMRTVTNVDDVDDASAGNSSLSPVEALDLREVDTLFAKLQDISIVGKV